MPEVIILVKGLGVASRCLLACLLAAVRMEGMVLVSFWIVGDVFFCFCVCVKVGGGDFF